MTRRDTIIVAILINAGLLTVLFITALTKHEEEWIESKPQIAEAFPKEERKVEPLPEIKKEEPELIQEEKKPELITHKLPQPIVQQEKPKETPKPILRKPERPQDKTCKEITVQKGDNLEKLAKKHHSSVQEIIRYNDLPNSFLRIGQVLKIPQSEKQSTEVQEEPKLKDAEKIEYYTVKAGDNPWTIAMKHHMNVKELLRLNNMDEKKARRLKPGDKLRIR